MEQTKLEYLHLNSDIRPNGDGGDPDDDALLNINMSGHSIRNKEM